MLDYTDLLSPNDYKKNDKIIYKYFKDKYDKKTGLEFTIKNRWNKKLTFRRNKNIIFWCAKCIKRHNLNLNYFEHFLLFISAASGCDLISAFPSSVGISAGIASSVLGLKICETTAEIKKYKWIIKKKKKTDDKIVLLAKQR